MNNKSLIPKVIGGYKIVELLGEGGMSVVYTAMQEHPRRRVAIKVLRGGMFSVNAAKRFYQEVEILGKLDHPWIAKIYDAGTHDDGNGATPFYVMEHVENARELTDYIDDMQPERRELLKLFTMVTSAVEHGHHRGIVHRDLKPGNILIDANNEPKIIDFGVARSLNQDTVTEEAMTEAGRLVGTVQFMAPEQVDAKIFDIDARCDVYALGAVLYQMLTKRLPRTLEGLPIYEAVRQICQEEPVKPTTYDASIDQNLESIILMALSTNREKRYETAGAFGRDMLRYLGNRPIKARQSTLFDHFKLFTLRHKKQFYGTIFFVSLLTLVGSIVISMRSEQSQEIETLQTQVEQLNKEKEVLIHGSAGTEVPGSKEIEELLLFASPPSVMVASTNGATFAAIIDDEYYAKNSDGQSIPLPIINIDPEGAHLALSQNGASLAVITSVSGRLVSLQQQTPTIKFSGNFPDISQVAATERCVAFTCKDMSIHLVGKSKDNLRALSNSGEFLAVEFSNMGDRLFAANNRDFYVWTVSSFPKQVRRVQGVKSPCFIGDRNGTTVLVGLRGQIRTFNSEMSLNIAQDLQLDSVIEQCAVGVNGKTIGYIAGGKAYKYTIASDITEELDWIPEPPVGIKFDLNNEVLLWTADGKLFQE